MRRRPLKSELRRPRRRSGGILLVFLRFCRIAVKVLSGATCDARVIRVDADSGRDIDGDRKYGRGS